MHSQWGQTCILRFRFRCLHVEYAEDIMEYGIVFISSLLYEYIHLEYVRVAV